MQSPALTQTKTTQILRCMLVTVLKRVVTSYRYTDIYSITPRLEQALRILHLLWLIRVPLQL